MRNKHLMLLISSISVIDVYLSDCDVSFRQPVEKAVSILKAIRRKELAKVIDENNTKLTK